MNPEQHPKADIGHYHNNLKGSGMMPKPGENRDKGPGITKNRFGKMVRSKKGRS